MKKTKDYHRAIFDAEVIKEAIEIYMRIASVKKVTYLLMTLNFGDEEWEYDELVKFYSDYRKPFQSAIFDSSMHGYGLAIYVDNTARVRTKVSIKAPTRSEIESIFEVFEKKVSESILPNPPKAKPIIFIGYGQSEQWRNLKDHLHEKHGYTIEAYEIGARGGHAIRDILEEMLEKSSFAVLVSRQLSF